MKSILLFLVLPVFTHSGWAQQATPTPLPPQEDIIGMQAIQKKLNSPFAAFIYVNDCNQMIHLNCGGDDTWYTLGVQARAGIPLKKAGVFMEAFAKSDLYTQTVGHDYVENGRNITQEIFTEIDEFGVSIRPYKVPKDFFLSVDVTGGVVNKKEPIPYMALWIQAGSDGRGGFHQLIHNQGKDNISRDDMKMFFSLKPRINKIIVLIDNEKKPFYAYLSVGPDLSTNKAMNTLNGNIQFSLPIIGHSRYFTVEFIVGGGAECSLHQTGLSVMPNLGFDLTLFKRAVISAYTVFPNGTSNDKLYDVAPDANYEPLLRATLKYKFEDKKNPYSK